MVSVTTVDVRLPLSEAPPRQSRRYPRLCGRSAFSLRRDASESNESVL